MNFFKTLTFLFFMISLSSCAFLRTATISSIPKERSKPITAKVSRTVFLGFNFDNDYLDNLPLMLARQCSNGTVRGILTKHEVISYFFVNTHNITASGYCTAR